MGFTPEEFARTRPYLYHLTARGNLSSIRASHRLFSATTLCDGATETPHLSQKRKDCISVNTARHGRVVLRDQQPLHSGNIAFEGGWAFADLLLDLNSRVYFWPGREDWLSTYAIGHFKRYAGTEVVVLRIATKDALSAAEAEHTRFNSGAPRTSGGRKSPRGPQTFMARPDWPPSKTVEVTFRGELALPERVDVWHAPDGGALPRVWDRL